MLLKQEFYLRGNEKPFFTVQIKKKITGFLVAENEIQRHGIKLYFEWFNYRPHLTVEVQPPPEGYEYARLMYKHIEISYHNFCRKSFSQTKLLEGKQYHLVQTRFWLPRLPFILKNPENFRVIYGRITLYN